MCELKEFRERVKQLAKDKSSDLILNKGVGHAACLLSAIFENSQEIKMFSGSLSKELTDNDEYIQSFKKLLDNCSSFELLLLNNPKKEERSSALKLVLNSKDPKIKVKYVKESKVYSLLKESNENNDVHFTLGDNNKYRYEYEPNLYRARASFNDINTNSILKKYFDNMFASAEEIN